MIIELLQAPPQPKYVAFGGTGRTLGSATPAPVSEAPATSPASGLEAANQPFQGLVVDESKPSTSIQVCLLSTLIFIIILSTITTTFAYQYVFVILKTYSFILFWVVTRLICLAPLENI